MPREYVLHRPDWQLVDMCERAMLRLGRLEYLAPESSDCLDAELWADLVHGEALSRIGGCC